MFHENLVEQILGLADAPLLIQEVSNRLEEERRRREQFYNRATNRDIDESMKVEFINGEIVVHSPVMKRHNEATTNLLVLLQTYVNIHDLGFVGYEKIMTVFTRNDYEPDLVFFGNSKAEKFSSDQTLFPVPDFIVEVLSKGTAKNDRGVKFDDYETHKVPEYWIVDAKNETVEQYVLVRNKYELVLKSTEGRLKSKVIKGFEIPIQAIFDKKTNLKVLNEIIKKA